MKQDVTIRKFRGADREAVRALCCDTGFLGQPIDPVFEDRELFANYLTRYYTDAEPEASFVVEKAGVVRGYLLGSRRMIRQQAFSVFNNLSLLTKGLLRYGRYNEASKSFVRWILTQAWKEVPEAPQRMAHFHFNVMPDARSLATILELTSRYFDFLREHGEKRVFGQIVSFEGRRGAALFERYGFTELNRAEITKYRGLHPGKVFLCTVVKDLG